MAQIKITLVKGVAGSLPAQRRTVKVLGLGKINSSVIREDNPVNRGMVNTVQHLVKVEEV
ncbi:MAG: 50S ribosomal protein L30 [Spirochaetales bacterium]|jgi:large subunit ribosomal protein L30|nr:50S ribosomal protein L30 [Spirochaetales bacterium]